MSLKYDHVRRLRALIARGMADPKNELELRLLHQHLYGRRDEIVRVEQKIKPAADDHPEGQGEEVYICNENFFAPSG